MRRRFTIALAGAFIALVSGMGFGAPAAEAARRYVPAPLAPAAKTPVRGDPHMAPGAGAGWRVSQYRQRYRPRSRPRWGGRGDFRRRYQPPNAGGNLISMREAVMLVRSRVRGRIANAGLRGRFAWFRVISGGRVLNVIVDRARRTVRIQRGF